MTVKDTIYCISALHIPLIKDYRPFNNDALSVYGYKRGYNILRDRFGYLNKFSPYNLYEENIPMYSSTSKKKLSDIIDERAEMILSTAKKNNKILYLFFSGGVDSTALVIAFIKVCCGDYKNICVVYSKHSVEENSTFVEFLKKNKIPMKEELPGYALDVSYQTAMEDGYAVDGNCADQLFGQGNLNNKFPELYHKGWHSWIESDIAIQQFEEAFDYYNLPIKTFGEFAWATNFLLKYNYVKHTDVLMFGKLSRNKFVFYDTTDFQDWSVSNFDILHKYPQHIPKYYKRELKEYIYSFNKDKSYLNNKGKFGSWHFIKDDDYTEIDYPIRISIMTSPYDVESYEIPLDVSQSFDNKNLIYKTLFLECTNKYIKRNCNGY